MASAQDQAKTLVGSYNSSAILDEMRLLGEVQGNNPSARKVLNSELWHACAGPLVSLPQPGSLVYYFPQGHSEQVTASTRKMANSHIPNYPNLTSQLLCQVHNVTLHADKDTDEIFAQMTLQPVNSEIDIFPIPDFGHTRSKQPSDFFCKNLTASDTSTHGGFSVPRRAAEKLFPQLDYSMQPPNQELIVRDLHDNLWTFRHIYRGQPKRHLLTTGWSLFVGSKRLKAGDSVLFIRDEKSQLLMGVRRANRQQMALPSSVLSADSMHIGVLAAAAHAAASRSPFTVYYNPRACPSEFIIPLAKYHKAVYTQVSIGMRFGMMFETEESSKRRYMGTIVGVSDLDPLRWPNSKWRNLQVEWDEHGYGKRPDRVSLWDIETPESLFVFPTPSLKRQCLPGFIVPETEMGFTNIKSLLQVPENGTGNLHSMFPGLGSEQLWKALLKPQNPIPDSQIGCHQSIYASILQKIRGSGIATAISSSSPALEVRSPLQQEVAASRTVMQHSQLPLVHQQKVLSQDQKSHHSIEQKVVELDCVAGMQMKPHDQFMEEAIHQNSCQGQNEQDHSVGGPESKCDSQLLQEAVIHQVKLTEEHSGGSPLGSSNCQNCVAQTVVDGLQSKEQDDLHLVQQQLKTATKQSPRPATPPPSDKDILNNLPTNIVYHSSQYLDHEDLMLHPSGYQPVTGQSKMSSSGLPESLLLPASDHAISPTADISSIVNPEALNPFDAFHFSCILDPRTPQCVPALIQEFFGAQGLNPPHEELIGPDMISSAMHELADGNEANELQRISNSFGMTDLSVESNNQSETYNNLHFDASNGNMITSSCVSSPVLEGFSTVRGASFNVPPEDLFGSFASNQEMQSQVTSASLADSQLLSIQEIPDSSGGTSSGSIDVNECSFLSRGAMKQVAQQPLRTYTKVQKLGSVGRSIDVTRFKNYYELKSAIACMFGLEEQLDDPKGSEWKLVYVDYENDVLLVGDDPWEEFVNCVRCIRILSPSEVQQMSQEGIQLMNSYLPSCS